jgi:hypothetical protein
MSNAATDAPAVDTAPPRRGLLARAIGIIFSPGETFKGVIRDPRPAGILFLVCLVLALAVGLPQFTERGLQAMLDMQVQSIERFTGQTVTPEMYRQMAAGARMAPYWTIGSMFIFVPAMVVLFSALFWFVFNALLGGTATFRQVLGVTAHSQVIGALGAVLAAPVQYVQGVWTQAGPFNLGALLPMLEPGGFLATFMGSIGVFMLWQLVVTAIGLALLYRRKTTPIAVGLTIAYLVIVAAVAAALSAIGGR